MSRWKGTPASSSRRNLPPPIPPPVLVAHHEPEPPPVVASNQGGATDSPRFEASPRRRSRRAMWRLMTLATILVLAGFGAKALWNTSHGWLDSLSNLVWNKAERCGSADIVDSSGLVGSDRSAVVAADDDIVEASSTVEIVNTVEDRIAETLPADAESLAATNSQHSNDSSVELIADAQSTSPDSTTELEDASINESASTQTEALVASEPVAETDAREPISPPPHPISPESGEPIAKVDLEAFTEKRADCENGVCVAPPKTLGTAIEWAENPEHAAELAREKGKLVFLIQVSGNFEREEFT